MLTQLQQQVSDLVSFARTQSPSWRGEWTLTLRPETHCLLDDAVTLGEIPHELEPLLYQPLRGQLFNGCEIETQPLLWDIAMIAPGLGDNSRPLPPTYWLDLATGEIAPWTKETIDDLRAH